ncbi:MAG: MIP family channel protein [Pirellulales bacterium]|nr:MIP family channel protein [Pirellulales bacterium]
MRTTLWRELAAEFLGTLVLVTFGVAVVAQVVLGTGEFGTYLSINFGWGLAVAMGIYVAGGVSGAHLNPAVTLALALFRGFSWAKVAPFIVTQVAAAFVASSLVFVTYHEALDYHDGGQRQIEGPKGTAGIWATYPNARGYLSNVPGGLVDQIVGAALFVGVTFALGDQRNNAPPAWLGPLTAGTLVALIGMTFGYNAGYAINPARDFGPRLFTAVAGWGGGVFRASDGWWWIPIAGPMIGGAVGGLIYEVFIGWHHPAVEPGDIGRIDSRD